MWRSPKYAVIKFENTKLIIGVGAPKKPTLEGRFGLAGLRLVWLGFAQSLVLLGLASFVLAQGLVLIGFASFGCGGFVRLLLQLLVMLLLLLLLLLLLRWFCEGAAAADAKTRRKKENPKMPEPPQTNSKPIVV